MPSSWDPEQYLRYAQERERPFWDLVGRIPVRSPCHVVDLGCGPGTATAGLVRHWPEASVLGIDSSEPMIAQAAAHGGPRLTFRLGDAVGWKPEAGSVDVILSNATLQWVPDHMALFAEWLVGLAPGGALAFQVPGNFEAPSHALLADLAGSAPWRDKLAGVGVRTDQPTPSDYHRHLRELGAAVDVWETTYYQVLTGPDPVLAWVRGSALRPILGALVTDDAAEFEAVYAEALRRAYPPGPGGETLFPFRRVFVVATRP
jgi:trans-aconitate 2-methyltransferase